MEVLGLGSPVPITSTVSTTQRVSVPSSLATSSQSITIPTPSLALTSTTQMVPIFVVSSALDTSQTAVPGSQTQRVPIPSLPISDVSSNSFSFPLHNVFDRISPDVLPLPRLVLEVISLVEHTDVHPVEVMSSHQTSREELEIPTVNDATDSLPDDVEHNHVSQRELVEILRVLMRVSHTHPMLSMMT